MTIRILHYLNDVKDTRLTGLEGLCSRQVGVGFINSSRISLFYVSSTSTDRLKYVYSQTAKPTMWFICSYNECTLARDRVLLFCSEIVQMSPTVSF
jgi:hypothetical protein